MIKTLVACVIQGIIITTQLCRDYNKQLEGSLLTSQYNEISQGFWSLLIWVFVRGLLKVIRSLWGWLSVGFFAAFWHDTKFIYVLWLEMDLSWSTFWKGYIQMSQLRKGARLGVSTPNRLRGCQPSCNVVFFVFNLPSWNLTVSYRRLQSIQKLPVQAFWSVAATETKE